MWLRELIFVGLILLLLRLMTEKLFWQMRVLMWDRQEGVSPKWVKFRH